MPRKPQAPAYRVDIQLKDAGGIFQPYSADRIDLDMALSLFQHLQRNATGARVVEVPSGKIIQEWLPGQPAKEEQ